MPTDIIDDNASLTDEESHQSNLNEDDIKSHPLYKELEEKHAAARQGMDKTNLSKKELQAEVARLRVLAGVPEEVKQEESKEAPITKKDLEEQLWLLQYTKDIEVYGDEKYQQDIKSGIPKAYALENAKLRYQSNPDKARIERQQMMSSGSASSDRNLESESLEGFNEDHAKRFNYTKETWIRHQQLKKERGIKS